MKKSFNRIWQAGWTNFRRTSYVSIGTTGVMTLVLLLFSGLLTLNFLSAALTGSLQEKVDVSTYFKQDVVAVIQQDAIERKGLKQLLFEPEMLKSVQPNVQLVGTLMSLGGRIPERPRSRRK